MTTIAEYLVAAEIEITPVQPGEAGAPEVSLPLAQGWQAVDAAMFPGAYGVYTRPPENGWADNVVLLVGRLSKPCNPAELLESAFADARQLPDWRELNAEIGDYQGFPSAAVTGTYSVDALILWVHTRYVIVAIGDYEYLVQLTVTARADGDGIEAGLLEGLEIRV
ncbi:LpqN/LpqT family lipoprotein [Nocardia acidivorans]|uniref:LpqN/LpqT family lipoprotein n=1 Tax=Nocardia acidivorans TaxID=404580 RepID=UPI0008317093|nr:LpqN/LpqT family lipoprotein [Nocardia acidivorans]